MSGSSASPDSVAREITSEHLESFARYSVNRLNAIHPAAVLGEMRDNARRGMDPVIVKAFINLTGVYPVGTLVILDTFELAIVHAVNPLQEMLSRPIVRVISDAQGNVLFPGTVADLADRGPEGGFLRTIIKTENPERYGIRIGDYFT